VLLLLMLEEEDEVRYELVEDMDVAGHCMEDTQEVEDVDIPLAAAGSFLVVVVLHRSRLEVVVHMRHTKVEQVDRQPFVGHMQHMEQMLVLAGKLQVRKRILD
jgi:hypothetical protein